MQMNYATSPVGPRELGRRRTRARLLRAGAELFADRGVTGARAIDISSRAGVAVGTLYLHFKDKEGLLNAILSASLGELRETLDQIEPADGDLEASLRRQLGALVGFVERRPDYARLLFGTRVGTAALRGELYELIAASQEKWLRSGIASGAARPDLDPALSAQAGVGMVLRVIDWWSERPDRAAPASLVDALTKLCLAGVSRP